MSFLLAISAFDDQPILKQFFPSSSFHGCNRSSALSIGAKIYNKLAQAAEFSNMPRTPPPVEGRMHMDAQTEEFLEELTDR